MGIDSEMPRRICTCIYLSRLALMAFYLSECYPRSIAQIAISPTALAVYWLRHSFRSCATVTVRYPESGMVFVYHSLYPEVRSRGISRLTTYLVDRTPPCSKDPNLLFITWFVWAIIHSHRGLQLHQIWDLENNCRNLLSWVVTNITRPYGWGRTNMRTLPQEIQSNWWILSSPVTGIKMTPSHGNMP